MTTGEMRAELVRSLLTAWLGREPSADELGSYEALSGDGLVRLEGELLASGWFERTARACEIAGRAVAAAQWREIGALAQAASKQGTSSERGGCR
jgi:hypothetical protein